MLSWFFKKGDHTQAPVAPKVPPPPAVLGAAAAAAPAAAGPDWAARLQAAQGDDAALLRIAASAPRLEIKMAAVQALAAEASLRQAEREFRSHDRKVHRLAKQRLEAAVAQREARARAQVLLERAAALVDEADVPINHVVELDHGWHALAADLLEPQQRTRFAELRALPEAALWHERLVALEERVTDLHRELQPLMRERRVQGRVRESSCGRITSSHAVRQAPGEPGMQNMMVPLAMPAKARDWMVAAPMSGIEAARNNSPKPSMALSNSGSSVSGATSRPVRPVLPVVRTTSTSGSAISADTSARST